MGSFIPCHPDCIRERKPGVAVDRLVIHRMQGTLTGTIAFFQQGAPPRRLASCTHFAVGYRGKGSARKLEVVQFAKMSQRLVHAGSTIERYWNDRSIGIELEGFVGDPWPDELIDACADLARVDILPRYPLILPDREHVVGHSDVPHRPTDAFHTDPGDNFPWDKFMLRLKGYVPAPGTPT